MSALATIGLSRDGYHRYFLDGKGPIPSVTTITGAALAKPFLIGWARRETALYATRNADFVSKLVADFGAEEAGNLLKTKTQKEADDKADLGTRIHGLAEQVLRGKPVTPKDDEVSSVEHFRSFLLEWTPRILAAEEMVCSEKYGYAGTFDFIAVIDGLVTLTDIKTGSGVYEETALQLAPYAKADFMGRAGDPKRYKIPPIERYAVLHLRPEGYELVPFDVTETDFNSFLACLQIYRWSKDRAPKVKGQPMQREKAAA